MFRMLISLIFWLENRLLDWHHCLLQRPAALSLRGLLADRSAGDNAARCNGVSFGVGRMRFCRLS